MAANPRVGADRQVRRGHGPIRIIGAEQLRHEVHAARTRGLGDTLIGGLGSSAFQAGDRRLGGVEAFRELALGEPRPPSRLSDQISRSHSLRIADTL